MKQEQCKAFMYVGLFLLPFFYSSCPYTFGRRGDIHSNAKPGLFPAHLQDIFDHGIVAIGGFNKELRAIPAMGI